MATPANRFDKVDVPDPTAVTVTILGAADAPRGEVVGPAPVQDGARPVSFGQDGSLSPLQALAIGCQMANELARDVVVIDREDRWEPAWGRLGS